MLDQLCVTMKNKWSRKLTSSVILITTMPVPMLVMWLRKNWRSSSETIIFTAMLQHYLYSLTTCLAISTFLGNSKNKKARFVLDDERESVRYFEVTEQVRLKGNRATCQWEMSKCWVLLLLRLLLNNVLLLLCIRFDSLPFDCLTSTKILQNFIKNIHKFQCSNICLICHARYFTQELIMVQGKISCTKQVVTEAHVKSLQYWHSCIKH